MTPRWLADWWSGSDLQHHPVFCAVLLGTLALGCVLIALRWVIGAFIVEVGLIMAFAVWLIDQTPGKPDA